MSRCWQAAGFARRSVRLRVGHTAAKIPCLLGRSRLRATGPWTAFSPFGETFGKRTTGTLVLEGRGDRAVTAEVHRLKSVPQGLLLVFKRECGKIAFQVVCQGRHGGVKPLLQRETTSG
jgi:hypothetical protein